MRKQIKEAKKLHGIMTKKPQTEELVDIFTHSGLKFSKISQTKAGSIDEGKTPEV